MQFMMLVNNIVTQMSPMVDGLAEKLTMLICPLHVIYVETVSLTKSKLATRLSWN